jgi:fungal STAND N-terminal Goodbye domain
MEPELRAMWEDAEQNFKTKTAKKLGRAGDAKTLDDVIREMESRKVEDDSDGGKIKNRAKDIGQKVLNCIQLLGGIAAQGASMVSTTSSYHFPICQCLSIGFCASWAVFQRGLIPNCYPRQG